MSESLVASGIWKTYRTEGGELAVLRGLDISVAAGEIVAVVGVSGVGKSTLLQVLGALDHPDRGEVRLGGIAVGGLGAEKLAAIRNRTVGFVFQFHYLLPEFTALENILIPHWIGKGRPPGAVVDKALGLMREMAILPIKDKYLNQISGGEQQRVAIARALVQEPKIVFADEPTGNLDRESGAAVLGIMTRMIRELGTTLIMVTHDREIALRADRILELVDGRICKSFRIADKGEKAARELLEDRSCSADGPEPGRGD